MRIGLLRERSDGERRVALTPAAIGQLGKAGAEVIVEHGAGAAAGYPDSAFEAVGCRLIEADAVIHEADVLTQVRCYPAQRPADDEQFGLLRLGQVCVGLAEPLTAVEPIDKLAAREVTSFALELIPRITRAQSMDVLSSQATVAGYRAVLLAAAYLPKIFPMLMTAAGTLAPARILVIGAGVAGLQAIATAKRNGAVVSAYDVRPAVKEQVESLGASFVELPLETEDAEGKGGYAKAMTEEFYRRQQELLANVIREQDVVITTAAIPGKPAPRLVTTEMVQSMAPGSVVVDLAAERGGNCELTRADEPVDHHGVTILGPTNLATEAPYHASQMFARNVTTFLLSMIKDGEFTIDLEDEVIRETLLTRDGAIVNSRVLEHFGREAPAAAHPAGGGGPAQEDGE